MMRFDFGEIVLVPLPFTSQATFKKRPAVVVSSLAYNAAKPDVILMAVTSQIRASATFGEIWLQDWKGAGLIRHIRASPCHPPARPSRRSRSGDSSPSHRADPRLTGSACSRHRFSPAAGTGELCTQPA
jgi:mRNA-degrading endonuclease toxin of MazEF toxin-antitoxin module